MTRLDRHVALVQGKLTLGKVLTALAWSLLTFGLACWIVVLAGKLFQVHLPRAWVFFWTGLGVAVAAGVARGLTQRPTARQAAVFIDERLALKEKFSTALYVRRMNDPFAAATVRDAERTADSVSLQNRFPVEYPRAGLATLSVGVLVLLTAWLFPSMDLFGVQAARQHKQQLARAEAVKAERNVRQALVQLEAAPKAVADTEAIKIAKQDLTNLLKRPITDTAVAQKKAEAALADMESAKEKIREQQKYAEAKNEAEMFKNMTAPTDEKGPIADAQRDMAKGDFTQAIEDVRKAVDNFDKMDQKEKDKAAEQMKKLAQQIQQKADDQKTQQQIQQQLQQMGATQQQAKQMQQAIQQAAQGNPQAQQQLQQMANQLAQQQNAKQGGSAQQQQQAAQNMQKAIQQMQQQANGQAQAQQMSQAAGQLAQAMQQAAQQSKQGQQGRQGQSAQGGQQGQQGQSGAGQQQQMAQAGQSMQQQLQQMQAMAKDGQAVAAGQQGGQPGQNGQQGQQGGQQGQQAGQQGQGGQWAQGNPNQQGQGGQGGAAQAAGQRPDPAAAPFGTKQEVSPSQTEEKGKILASSFVNAGADKGTSKAGLSNEILKEEQDATDEVDQDRIPRSAQKAVKEYFETLKQDGK